METDISRKEMLEKIAELEHSQSQLRELNAEMRHWLDFADDDVAAHRSENAVLRKQVKELKKTISEAEQVDTEPYGDLLDSDLNEIKSSDKKIQDLEKESTMVKEENKKLMRMLKTLEDEFNQEKITLSKFRAAFQSLENELEEAQLELQHRYDVIRQKSLQVNHLEETVEEYNNIIKDLRLTKQELKKQLEDRQDEASFAVLTEVLREDEGSVNLHLSLAEEIQMLMSSAEMNTSMLYSTHLTGVTSEEEKYEGTGAEELLDSQSLANNCEPQSGSRFAKIPKTAIYGAKLFMMCIFACSFVFLMVLGCCAVDLFSVCDLQSSARLVSQPYFSVHYDALPPL